MVSSKKPKETKPRSDGVNKLGGRNTRGSSSLRGSSSKTKKTLKIGGNAKKEPEIYEISESSCSDSVEKARDNKPSKSNGVMIKGRNGKSVAIPVKRKKIGEEDDGDDVGGSVEDAKMFRFPMNRIRRIMRSDDIAPQIMQDAVFLVNKATEMFIERFSEEAYESSVQDKKKFIHYKHLSSVVSNEERYEFLAECVPEKLKAEVALEEWESSMTDAG